MNSSGENSFNAKILLFGEYSLLFGSMALSIPFDRFNGKLVWPEGLKPDVEDELSNKHIKKFFDYILDLDRKKKLEVSLDFNRIARDIQSGLYFKSNITQGYGLGSSGALVAALVKEYGNIDIIKNRLLDLKIFFATLESYFHGQSSGLDPLISFVNKPVLISGKNKVETIDRRLKNNNGSGAVFLIDTGSGGETQPLVNHFKSCMKDKSFSETVNNDLIPVVNNAIKAYTKGETELLLAYTNKISEFQAEYFKMMIPDSVKDIWYNGLETKKYSIKLCGSGGGGMMLGFTNDLIAAEKELVEFNPIIVHSI